MLKKIYIGSALFLFLISLFIGLDRFLHRSSARFSIHKITSAHNASPEWDIPALSTDDRSALDQILNQKFTYYSSGSQVYVFVSEDKKYILKFLKQQQLQVKSWLAYIPFSFNPYYQEYVSKQKKCKAIFSACTTAFLELKKEAGLIYVHINNKRDLNKKVEILDKSGRCHTIDIDKTSFYIQKRAQPIYSRISELMHNGDIEGAKKIICSLFSLIDDLGKKGVVDNAPIFSKNFGLIEDTAVQIDIGKLRIDPLSKRTLAYKQKIENDTHSFKVWLEKTHPELAEHFTYCLSRMSDWPDAAPRPEYTASTPGNSPEPKHLAFPRFPWPLA